MGTHPQLVDCAVSQCVWRDENGEFLGSTTVAEGMCEYGGACSWSVRASDVQLVGFTVPGR
jgi:hypothetical protein